MRRLAITVLGLALLAGCGQKGDLFLPPPAPPAESATTGS
ncbi:lipoprotein [Motiliproteus sp. SC1-56]|nr:lipoprotein [Motiliproteus sp. SC1-56]